LQTPSKNVNGKPETKLFVKEISGWLGFLRFGPKRVKYPFQTTNLRGIWTVSGKAVVAIPEYDSLYF
jgi:hypothetical protein